MQHGVWDKVIADSAPALALTNAGGPTLIPARRTFELYAAIGGYMQDMSPARYTPFVQLKAKIIDDVVATPSDEAAKAFASIYWSTDAWTETLMNHLATRKQPVPRPTLARRDGGSRIRAALGESDEVNNDPGCKREMKQRTKPDYPISALYKGFVGTVILRADVDAQGMVSNPVLLASVPEASFGEAAMKAAPHMHFEPGRVWDNKRCTLASKGQVIVFPFIPRR
jgi:TonB family protein